MVNLTIIPFEEDKVRGRVLISYVSNIDKNYNLAEQGFLTSEKARYVEIKIWYSLYEKIFSAEYIIYHAEGYPKILEYEYDTTLEELEKTIGLALPWERREDAIDLLSVAILIAERNARCYESV